MNAALTDVAMTLSHHTCLSFVHRLTGTDAALPQAAAHSLACLYLVHVHPSGIPADVAAVRLRLHPAVLERLDGT